MSGAPSGATSGATRTTPTETGRAGAVGAVLAVLAVAAAAGFLAGAILGGDRADVPQGLMLAAVFVVPAAFVVALVGWRTRRRAAKLGLGAARYMKVIRGIRRGEVPDDPAELPAAIDGAKRARRALDLQDSRWVWWLLGGVALLWLVSGVFQALDGRYLRAGCNLVMAGLFLVNPLTVRRNRRRLEAVEQALRERGHLRDPSDGTELPAGPAGQGTRP